MKTKLNDIINIFLICFVIGICRSLLFNDISIIKVAPEAVESLDEAISEPVIIDIDLCKQLFDDGALFVDARDSSMFAEGHIENAISIPFENLDESEIDSRFSLIELDQEIVIYCSGGDCTLSLDLGNYLYDELSFKKIYLFESGYPAWKSKGYSIKKICLVDDTNEMNDEECVYVK